MINGYGFNPGLEEEAKMATHMLNTNAAKKNLTLAELTIDLPLLGQGGIRSAVLVSTLFGFEAKLFNWRKDGGSQHYA